MIMGRLERVLIVVQYTHTHTFACVDAVSFLNKYFNNWCITYVSPISHWYVSGSFLADNDDNNDDDDDTIVVCE